MEAIEIEVDQIQLGQRAALPGLDLGLQPLHDPTDRALDQRATRQQRPIGRGSGNAR